MDSRAAGIGLIPNTKMDSRAPKIGFPSSPKLDFRYKNGFPEHQSMDFKNAYVSHPPPPPYPGLKVSPSTRENPFSALKMRISTCLFERFGCRPQHPDQERPKGAPSAAKSAPRAAKSYPRAAASSKKQQRTCFPFAREHHLL